MVGFCRSAQLEILEPLKRVPCTRKPHIPPSWGEDSELCAFAVSPLPLEGCRGPRGLGAVSIFLRLREKSQDRPSCPSCRALPATRAPAPRFLLCCPDVGLRPRALSEVRGPEPGAVGAASVPLAWAEGRGRSARRVPAWGRGGRGRELLLLSFLSAFSWFCAPSRCCPLLTGSCSSHKIYFPQIP